MRDILISQELFTYMMSLFYIFYSFYHSIILSFYHSIILSFYHSIILSFYHSIILSFKDASYLYSKIGRTLKGRTTSSSRAVGRRCPNNRTQSLKIQNKPLKNPQNDTLQFLFGLICL